MKFISSAVAWPSRSLNLVFTLECPGKTFALSKFFMTSFPAHGGIATSLITQQRGTVTLMKVRLPSAMGRRKAYGSDWRAGGGDRGWVVVASRISRQGGEWVS